MRILIVLSSSGFFRHFDTVVRHLCEEGHEVKVLTRMARKGDEDDDYQDEMLASVASYEHGSYDFNLHKRQDRLKALVRTLRGIFNYAIYFRLQHNSPQLAERLAPDCPEPLRSWIATRAGRCVISSDRFLRATRRLLGQTVPADRALVDQVAAERPDVVVACPFIYTMSADVEYVRAARQLGIPTVAAVASWDNLSTKGAFQLLTDRVLVWNAELASEAELIHAIPRGRIESTGAAKFDGYFELGPSLAREEFCANIGVEADRPYLLYLGSSDQVAGDETDFVRELAQAMRGDRRTEALRIVVRPHPLNAKVWEDFEESGITVFPRRGQRPDLPRYRADYFNTLTYAAAVIGVNTTAFLEAAIADRPCLSIVSERHREGQVDRGHFHHLLEGGFLEAVPNFDGAVQVMGDILEGRDERRDSRRRFVEHFVRPAGRDRPAGEVMASAILRVAARGAQRASWLGHRRRRALASERPRANDDQTYAPSRAEPDTLARAASAPYRS